MSEALAAYLTIHRDHGVTSRPVGTHVQHSCPRCRAVLSVPDGH